MDEDDSLSIETLDSSPAPPSTSESDDCRINCSDHQSLCSIVKVTLAQVSELADSLNLKDDRPEIIAKFNDSFKNALQENIVINGLPWMMDKSKLTSSQEEDHKEMVDLALLAKFSKTVADVAQKRKFCPEQCCRITNIKMKHELQNLKRAKVLNDSPLHNNFNETSITRKRTKPFVNFCKEFKTFQENIQYMCEKRRKLEMKMSLVYDIQRSQKIKSNQVAEETCMLKKKP